MCVLEWDVENFQGTIYEKVERYPEILEMKAHFSKCNS
jgi:hypothetical protein